MDYILAKGCPAVRATTLPPTGGVRARRRIGFIRA
jgi:hypothetical protein